MIEAGEGPPVLLLHCGSTSSLSLLSLLERLERVRAIAVDRPGFRLSEPVRVHRERFRDAAIEFLDEVLDQLGLHTSTLAGSSMGGTWALWYALARLPEREIENELATLEAERAVLDAEQDLAPSSPPASLLSDLRKSGAEAVAAGEPRQVKEPPGGGGQPHRRGVTGAPSPTLWGESDQTSDAWCGFVCASDCARGVRPEAWASRGSSNLSIRRDGRGHQRPETRN